ncbi:MAG: 4Fe-4S binding protein [Bacteroidales bacterium]|nr:4Fe-4S binding protein [Bacteroidales bacterium]
MEKTPLVSINPDKCTSCYTCVRICPVKAISVNIKNPQPEIQPERCIGCGDCIKMCVPGAIYYRSGIEQAKQLLATKAKKVAIVSPSISAEFDDITDYRKFVQMIKSLNIDHVNEVSFAVDILAYKYLSLFGDFKGRYYITSCDPVVVSFVEKYHPNLVNNLTPFVPPMIAMSKIVHKKYGDDIKVIYIGPDIASKDVALKFSGSSKVDVVLTFPELRQLFKEMHIEENNVEFSEFDPPLGYKGSLYPIRNGFIQAADIDENLLTSMVISVEGKKEMLESIDEFEDNVKVIHRHLHVTYGNSLAGPGITDKGNQLFKEHLVIKYANKRLMNFYRAEWYHNLQEYITIDYNRQFEPNNQRLPDPPVAKVAEALKTLNWKPGRHSDCGQCGYASCRDFAIDMAKGIVIPEMCATFAISNSKYYSDTLKELNEKLTETRKALKETEDKVESEHNAATQALELTDAMLEKLRAGIVIVDYKLKIIKSNSTFCTILGGDAEEINEVIPGLAGADLNKLFTEDICNLFDYVLKNSESIDGRDVRHGESLLNISIFPIRENQVAGGIIRDMRAPEVQRAEVTRRVSEVIDKNLEMVQKIGFLLGESAADIEKMLNSVIQIYNEKK